MADMNETAATELWIEDDFSPELIVRSGHCFRSFASQASYLQALKKARRQV